MKKMFSYLILTFGIIISLSACSSSKIDENETTVPTQALQQIDITPKKLHIVASTFPQYDWVRQILGDKIEDVELTLLVDGGVDLHSFQPTVEDIAKISTCDIFIYVGGVSDGWVHKALETATNKKMTVINMLEVLGDKVKEEEIIEGMEHTHEHDHEEIDPEHIQDRPLSDWAGSWGSIETIMESKDLQDYITHQAEVDEIRFEDQKEIYAKRWKTDYTNLTITDTIIEFSGNQSEYKYVGYKLVETESGSSVWYGFESTETKDSLPKYVAFSDHSTGESHEDEPEGAHEEEVPHYHFRYGDESFEALTTMEEWTPTYFASTATPEEIATVMGEQSHADEEIEDEHVWLSLKNAEILCIKIAAVLETMDAQNAATYKANAEKYIKALSDLDSEYQNMVDNAAVKTLLFGDRFPFRYLVDDYGIQYYGAFSGCSAETEASFETIVFLSNKINELNLKNIMVIDGSKASIANTIVDNTTTKNQQVKILDSMQSVTAKDIADGKTYLSIMENNLKVLKEALS